MHVLILKYTSKMHVWMFIAGEHLHLYGRGHKENILVVCMYLHSQDQGQDCFGFVVSGFEFHTLFLYSRLLSLNENIVNQSRIQMYLNFQAVTQIFSPSTIAPGLCTENMLFLQGLAGTCCSLYEK